MAADARGLALSGSAEAVSSYDRALDHLVRFQSEVVHTAAAAVAADPGCAMAKLFCAYLALMSTEESATAGAIDAVDGLRAGADDLLPRERASLRRSRFRPKAHHVTCLKWTSRFRRRRSNPSPH